MFPGRPSGRGEQQASSSSSLICIALIAYTSLTLPHCALGQKNKPSEFLGSFLSRARLLPNASSVLEPRLKRPDALTLSLFVDNWSAFTLVYNAHAVSSGVLETSFPPRNMPEKKRGFALRTVGTEGSSRTTRTTGGMVGWTLVGASDGIKVSRLSLGWELDKDENVKFALALGDFVPQYDQLWENRDSGRLLSVVSSQIGDLLRVADSRTTVAAQLKRHSPLHYKLHVTIIPQNVDVWGWVKYFKEAGEEGGKGSSSQPDWHKRSHVEPEKQQPLPKITKNSGGASGREINELPSASTKTPGSRMVTEQQQSTPLYHKKEFLREGPALIDLHDKGIASLREALKEKTEDHSVAVGIQLENWSRFRLGDTKVEISSGKLLSELHPRPVAPGDQDVSLVASSGSMTGTSGVARWTIGSETNTVLSVMWSVPYNLQFWSTWVSVGLTPADEPLPTYEQMYGEKDDAKYVTVKAGREFEFSDGRFIVMAYMDGGTSTKPILRVGLVPLANDNLASSIKRRLGMKVSKGDDLKETRLPQVSQVQSTAGSGRVQSASSVSRVLTALGLSWMVSKVMGH